MIHFFSPHPLLQDWIQCIMVIHHVTDPAAAPGVCLYPPTPQPSLFFYIGDRIKVKTGTDQQFVEQPRAVLVGQQLTTVSLDINRDHRAVRVGFHPGGMHRLLGIPMDEMADRHCAASDIFGGEIHEVNEQLAEAEDADGIRMIVESFLLKQLKRLKPASAFDHSMAALLRAHGNMSMEETASLACLSLRQFERVSRARLGTSPKLFARIARFSKAYRLREEFPERSWTDIAYECGYFDQMHFIRDFKQFSGQTPRFAEKRLALQPARMQVGLRL